MAKAIIFKRCSTCQETKPTSEFHRNRSRSGGRNEGRLHLFASAATRRQRRLSADTPSRTKAKHMPKSLGKVLRGEPVRFAL